MNVTVIWQPKYCTKEVLVSTMKVRDGKNYLFFAEANSYPDLYSYDGTKVKKECNVTSNGKIYCYCIPLSWLNSEGDLPTDLIPIRERELTKLRESQRKSRKK